MEPAAPDLIVAALATTFNLVVWGAHALAPWRLAGAEPERRRPWVVLAVPLLLAAIAITLATIAAHPDAAIATGLSSLRAALAPRVVALLALATLAADVLVILAWRELEPAGWRIVGGVGLAASLAAAYGGEVLRVGEGPHTEASIFLLAVGARWVLMLGAGEALSPGRPWLSVAAAAAMPLYLLAQPAEVGVPLTRGSFALTAAAGALLLTAARWLPRRLRRPTLLAGALLVALVFAQAATLSAARANRLVPPSSPLVPQ